MHPSEAFLASSASEIETPAFVVDEIRLRENATRILRLTRPHDIQLLFPLKSSSWWDVVRILGDQIDGFAVSSLFEARMASGASKTFQQTHLTTPGLTESVCAELAQLCHLVSFNSEGQFARFSDTFAANGVSCGIRVNPELSFVTDARYDPCQTHSKLGVPLQALNSWLQQKTRDTPHVRGLHFHSNCESRNLDELLQTALRVREALDWFEEPIEWVNMGGGYLFDENVTSEDLVPIVEALGTSRRLFLEPGAGLVQNAGYLVASVIDLFQREGRIIAVLDTSVNHWPEILEYQFAPEVLGSTSEGPFEYSLVGCTCLAGDQLGVYQFAKKLEIGTRVVITNAGAYSFVKSHYFNGVNLPSIYLLKNGDQIVLRRQFNYADFANRCGVDVNALA